MDRKYEASYFEQRFRNRIYEAVIKAVEQAANDNKWKRKDLAARIGKKPSQLTKWLAGPGNWTLDTVSNLLFAINAELDFHVSAFAEKEKSNEFHDLNWHVEPLAKKPPKAVDTTGGIVILPPPATPTRAVRPVAPLVKANGQFNRSQHRVLRSLAMWKALGHDNPSREMVAAASGYSPSSGGFNNLLGGLATAGAIGKPMPGHLNLLMDVDEMSADEGREMLLGYLTNPQRRLVDALNGAGGMSRDDLGAATEYSPSSGGFNNLIGSLSTLGLIVKPQTGHVALADWAQELIGNQ